jgi:hypothetical protein
VKSNECNRSQDSLVVQCWTMGWTIGGLSPGRGWEILFTTMTRLALGPSQPPMQWEPGALSLGVMWPGHEADHLPPSSIKVKNAWSYIPPPPPPNMPPGCGSQL